MNVIIFLGPPGSGKGTMSEKVAGATDYAHLSTGDMLRQAVADKTPLGEKAEEYMKKGELVPDELMIDLVEERLKSGSGGGSYMLDGFPRTMNQAELLEKALGAGEAGGKGKEAIRNVFFLDAPREVLIERLTGRRICRKCGTNYHIKNFPPGVDGVCDKCGGELYQRPDDTKDTIGRRLEVYTRQTEALKAHYESMGLLVYIDADRDVKDIVADIVNVLKRDGGGDSRQ
ncbi:MAG: adenylate kinase [Kiritimatiellia bacterium]